MHAAWDALRSDVRFALRALRRNPGFFAAAAIIVGLGVGANTAVFSVAHALLVRPLPFEQPERLVWIANDGEGGMSAVTSRTSNLRDFRRMNESFEDIGAYFAFFDYGSVNLIGHGEPRRLVNVGVTETFLPLLGVDPLHGRHFAPEECVWEGRPAAMLTHRLWREMFNSDPEIVGQAVTLDDDSVTVVGVLPRWFDFATFFSPTSRIDLITPFSVSDETDRWGNTLAMIGRLKPGVTAGEAQAELDVILDQLRRQDPERWGLGAVVTPLQEQLTGSFQTALYVLLAAVGLVLLIVCTNLSNLLLARAAARRKEMAIRAALGAGRWRLIRQTLTESLLLAVAGGALGVALAWLAVRAVAASSAVQIPLLASVELDASALLFTLGVTLATGVLFGIVPALQLAGDGTQGALKDSGRGTSEGKGRKWVRSALVVSEVALASVLLVGAGLLLRSFVTLLEVDLGFRAEQAGAWRIETGDGYDDNDALLGLYSRLRDSVSAIPGVESVGITDTLPLGRNRSWDLRAEGVEYAPGAAPNAFPRVVDSGYLDAMNIPLVAGRPLEPHDMEEGAGAVVLSESAAQRLWPGRDPIGQNAMTAGRPWRVVGVVSDVRHRSLEDAGGLEMYLPMQRGEGLSSRSVELVVRTRRPLETLAPAIRQAIQQIDPRIPADDYQALTALVDRAVSPRKFVLGLLGAFAFVALVLACLGIYGVISYGVNQQVPEIGIRMALGATADRIRRGVLGRTLRLAGIGLVIGIAASLLLARLVESMLYGVTNRDPLTLAAAIGILLMVALLAGYLPARRASRVAPSSALRAG